MNQKTLKVYLVLLNNNMKWMNTQEVGYQTNLTSRQVCSIISQFPSPPLEKERCTNGSGTCDHSLYLRWNESDEDSTKRKHDIINEYYNLTPAMHESVLNTLSPVGWMSVYDICSETGLSKDAVARIVRMSDGVEMETSGRISLYRKTLEASDL